MFHVIYVQPLSYKTNIFLSIKKVGFSRFFTIILKENRRNNYCLITISNPDTFEPFSHNRLKEVAIGSYGHYIYLLKTVTIFSSIQKYFPLLQSYLSLQYKCSGDILQLYG